MEAIEAILSINRIFKKNKWHEKDAQDLAMEGFCRLLDSLEPEQRILLLELTNNYQWISHDEYRDKFVQAMEAISEDQLTDVKKIHFFPIIKPEDENKVKSGEHLFYIIKSFKRLMTKYNHIQFEYLKTFDQLQALKLESEERLFLVDDYIGSGDTFNHCLTEVAKNSSLSSSAIKVVCIAIQEDTQLNLVLEGYAVLKTIVLKKGITDYNERAVAEEKKTLMREIERNIPGSKPVSLGYNETEALITMARTPDNTFPIFWKKFRKEGKYFDAPFARYDEQ